jgi:hypothetical protein
MDPSTGERGNKFDKDFMTWMTACGVGKKVHLEITKRYISTAEDEAVLSREARECVFKTQSAWHSI